MLIVYHSVLHSFYLWEIKDILKKIFELLSQQSNNQS